MISEFLLTKIFMDVRYNLINCVSWSRVAIGGKQMLFQVQTSPKAGKTRFHKFLCAITSITTLIIASIDPKGKTRAFSSSNESQRRKN
ncbi:hypothetical protein H5410_056100 [Solanum commersonii]|uniref:Uncharacterized protein n=1 Tax=Solanum commersonii TaxID=4109 RepID=A0A9J5WM47_SOLCO|nr:hypothetical protein H5410_056100 [Solanum commersonii]